MGPAGSTTRNRGDGVSPTYGFSSMPTRQGRENGWTNRRLFSPDFRFVISPRLPGLTAARSDTALIEGSTVPWGATAPRERGQIAQHQNSRVGLESMVGRTAPTRNSPSSIREVIA